MSINIEWQDQFGRWHHYQTKQNQADAYRVAQRRAQSTGKRHRLKDTSGRTLDIFDQADCRITKEALTNIQTNGIICKSHMR